jgi:hypothetical protein
MFPMEGEFTIGGSTMKSLFTLLLALPALMLSGIALGSDINLAADQRPVEDTIKGRGIARYAVNANGVRTLLNDAQRYAINLPSPMNEVIGITDEESAQEADVELWLADPDGEPYARCQLKGGDKVKVNPLGIEHVTYKLTVRKSGERVRGDSCTDDINIDPGDLQPNSGIMPLVAEGDLAQGVVIVDGEPVLALEGEFE